MGYIYGISPERLVSHVNQTAGPRLAGLVCPVVQCSAIKNKHWLLQIESFECNLIGDTFGTRLDYVNIQGFSIFLFR
jgi:hypothetical protein